MLRVVFFLPWSFFGSTHCNRWSTSALILATSSGGSFSSSRNMGGGKSISPSSELSPSPLSPLSTRALALSCSSSPKAWIRTSRDSPDPSRAQMSCSCRAVRRLVLDLALSSILSSMTLLAYLAAALQTNAAPVCTCSLFPQTNRQHLTSLLLQPLSRSSIYFHFPELSFLSLCPELPGFCFPPAVLHSKVNFSFFPPPVHPLLLTCALWTLSSLPESQTVTKVQLENSALKWGDVTLKWRGGQRKQISKQRRRQVKKHIRKPYSSGCKHLWFQLKKNSRKRQKTFWPFYSRNKYTSLNKEEKINIK